MPYKHPAWPWERRRCQRCHRDRFCTPYLERWLCIACLPAAPDTHDRDRHPARAVTPPSAKKA